jgi:PadR family transcriptional regulator PadR
VARPPAASPQTLPVLDQLLREAEVWPCGYGVSRSTGLKSSTLHPILIRLADRSWLEPQSMIGRLTDRDPASMLAAPVARG